MGKMLVYHGSSVEVSVPQILQGRNTKDFGTGFYCTLIREQAERWALRYDTSVINVYSLLIDEDLKILEFPAMTEEWLDFIAACRSGKMHDYDVVMGPMADDQIYNFVSDFITGIITRKQFWALARFKYPTHQICFCTPEALQCLRFEQSEALKQL